MSSCYLDYSAYGSPQRSLRRAASKRGTRLRVHALQSQGGALNHELSPYVELLSNEHLGKEVCVGTLLLHAVSECANFDPVLPDRVRTRGRSLKNDVAHLADGISVAHGNADIADLL